MFNFFAFNYSVLFYSFCHSLCMYMCVCLYIISVYFSVPLLHLLNSLCQLMIDGVRLVFCVYLCNW